MKSSYIINAVFLFYFIALIIIGFLAHKKMQKSENFSAEYWVGGRSFGPWLVAFTWATSWTSGGSFIGTPAVYYTYGWSALLWQAGAGVLGIIGILAIGRRVSTIATESNCMTLPDLFMDRYENKLMGFLAALIIIIFGISYMISQYVAAARILEIMTGIPYVIGIIIFTIVVGLYTSIGGLRGVAYTNVFQGAIMVIGSIIIAILLITKAEGLTNISTSLANLDPQLINGPGPDDWLPINTAFSMFFVLGVAVMAQPHVVTRLFSVKDVNTVKKSGVLVSIVTFVWFISLFISSIAGRVLIPNIDVPDQIFPTLVIRYAPTLIAGIMLSAPFAAVMSTVSSLLLSTSSAIIRDIIERNMNKRLEDSKLKKFNYLTTGLISLLVMFLAINPPAFLQAIVIFAISGFAASFTIPIAVGLFWSGATPKGGLFSMISGFLTMLFLYLFKIENPLGFNPLVWGLFISLIVIIVVSKITKQSSDNVLERYFGI
ncbi:sodium/pantothenate symporter [Peptoniphilus olsenii]|uniref:Sodium/pantothenate symporter n=1 Tax=Peptoniphilus olsenii TaxID=411570 RepID=A0ABV2JAH3_9FIRM